MIEGRELPKELQLEQQWEDAARIFSFGREDGLPSEIDIEVRILDLDRESKELPNRTAFVIGGVGEDTDVMKPFLLALAKQGIQVVGISMPSHGRSGDVTRDWRVDPKTGEDKVDFVDYSHLLFRLHEELERSDDHPNDRPVAEQIDLIGHSLGGAIAADAAMRHTEMLRSLHLIAPAGNKAEFTIPKLRIPPATFWNFAKAHFGEQVPTSVQAAFGSNDEIPVMSHLWLDNFFRTSQGVNHLKALDDSGRAPRLVQRFWEGKVTAQGKLGSHISAAREHDIPIHLYVGADDKLFPPEEYQNLVDQGVNMQVIENSAHYGILHQVDAYIRAITANMR